MSEHSTLSEQLLRRTTEPLGVIDTHRPRERHDRVQTHLRRYVSPVLHLIARAGEDAPPAAAAGLVLASPPASSPHERLSAESGTVTAHARTTDVEPTRVRARVVPSPARSDREPIAQRVTSRAARASINDAGSPGGVTTIHRATGGPSPLTESAGMPFFTPASRSEYAADRVAGVSSGQARYSEVSGESTTSGTIQPAASTHARGQRQVPAAESNGNRGDRSGSPGTPLSRRQTPPIARGRATPAATTGSTAPAARSTDVLVQRRIDAPTAAVVAEAPSTSLTLSRPATTVVQRTGNTTVSHGQPPSDGVTAATETPASMVNADPSMTLAHHVQRAPIVRTVATTDQSMPGGGPLPLHSVNTGRITAAIARSAAVPAGTAPLTIARATSEPVSMVTSGSTTTSPATGGDEQTGGGGSLSPDRMMSHMLRQIAIERERRGGGRWP
jgi:hypothetical protein